MTSENPLASPHELPPTATAIEVARGEAVLPPIDRQWVSAAVVVAEVALGMRDPLTVSEEDIETMRGHAAELEDMYGIQGAAVVRASLHLSE